MSKNKNHSKLPSIEPYGNGYTAPSLREQGYNPDTSPLYWKNRAKATTIEVKTISDVEAIDVIHLTKAALDATVEQQTYESHNGVVLTPQESQELNDLKHS